MRINNDFSKRYNESLRVKITGFYTGPVVLANDPSSPLEAASKQYVDNLFTNLSSSSITTGIFPEARLPSYSGDASSAQNNNTFTLNTFMAIPGTYTKATIDPKGRSTLGAIITEADIPNLAFSNITEGKPTTLIGYGITDLLSHSNSVINDNLTVTGSTVNAQHVATKAYVDQLANTIGASINVGDVIPYPSLTPIANTLRCNGAELDKITYADLYAVVGDSFSYSVVPGAGKPWQNQYYINTLQSGDISGWTTTTSLPGNKGDSHAIVTKNRVYLLGGSSNTTAVMSVYTAPINADGTIGAWTTGPALPNPLKLSQAIVTKNRVYLLGGENEFNTVDVVYTAPINTDGTLGAWTTDVSLPGALSRSQAIVTKSRVYLISGANTGGVSDLVYTAPINTDGTIGIWSIDTPIPAIVADASSIVVKGVVYLIGGMTGSTRLSTVYKSTINPDGTLGAWSLGDPIPVGTSESCIVVTKNKVYLIGGTTNSGTTSTSNVYVSTITANGELGAWVLSTPVIGIVNRSQVVVTSSKIYIPGSPTTNTVYVANFLGGSNDYSQYYDGTITATDSANFRIPDLTQLEEVGKYYYIKH